MTVSSDDGGAVHVWDLTRRRPLGPPFTGHLGLVWSVAVAEVGGRTLVASAGEVLAVKLTDLDGRPVVESTGADRSVQVWDLATRHPVGAPYRRHDETVACLGIGVA